MLFRSNSSGARLLLGLNQRSPLSLNAYSYVNNSPTNLHDPYGLDPEGPNPFNLSGVFSLESMMNLDYPVSAASQAWTAAAAAEQIQLWTDLQNAQAQIFAIQQQVASTPYAPSQAWFCGDSQNYARWSEFLLP